MQGHADAGAREARRVRDAHQRHVSFRRRCMLRRARRGEGRCRGSRCRGQAREADAGAREARRGHARACDARLHGGDLLARRARATERSARGLWPRALKVLRALCL
jgi:hypothetical protein